ncbi:phage minor head protein [Methylomonas sp. BW4-1]|uniref:phage head morphogenesis protein n=1 Tax=Methylomonas sp. BW4-1 TaxID=3376685 RepID=UPI004041FF3E
MASQQSPTQRAFGAGSNGKFDKPFSEQIKLFREKVLLPTEHYNDLLKSAHDRAFVVAGVMKADLLNDIHQALAKTMAEGKSIQWFRKEFASIVAKNGWGGVGTNAKRDWRARVIYRTNLSTAYAAGRWRQLNDPDLLKRRPYWKYVHNETVRHPRPLHQSWNGLVLRHDAPWWLTHYPPNGWGCRCRVVAVPASEYTGQTTPNDGYRTETDRFGNTHQVPNGIDFGWDYAPCASRSVELKTLIDEKLMRFPAALGAEMWKALKPALADENRKIWAETISAWIVKPEKPQQPLLDWRPGACRIGGIGSPK